MKILLVNNTMLYMGLMFAKNLSPFFDKVTLSGTICRTKYKFELLDNLKLEDYYIHPEDVPIKDYDIIFIMDPGSFNAAPFFKKNTNAVVGGQILDYPIHAIYEESPFFNRSLHERWKQWRQYILDLDFVVLCKENIKDSLYNYYKNTKHTYITFPIIDVESSLFDFSSVDQQEENYIIYSGRIKPDKRIHNIVDALSLSETKPKLYIVGVSDADKTYENYLQKTSKERDVECLILNDVSERKKFELYYNSLFVVSAHYGYCTSSCVGEGLFLGKNAICLDGSYESRKTFGNHIEYCDEDINIFAKKIDLLCRNKEYRDKYKKERMAFANSYLSYKVWAKKIYHFLSEYEVSSI